MIENVSPRKLNGSNKEDENFDMENLNPQVPDTRIKQLRSPLKSPKDYHKIPRKSSGMDEMHSINRKTLVLATMRPPPSILLHDWHKSATLIVANPSDNPDMIKFDITNFNHSCILFLLDGTALTDGWYEIPPNSDIHLILQWNSSEYFDLKARLGVYSNLLKRHFPVYVSCEFPKSKMASEIKPLSNRTSYSTHKRSTLNMKMEKKRSSYKSSPIRKIRISERSLLKSLSPAKKKISLNKDHMAQKLRDTELKQGPMSGSKLSEIACTEWLNYELIGQNCSNLFLTPDECQSAVQSRPNYSAYTKLREREHLRANALKICRSEIFDKISQRLDLEISEGKLAVKDDSNLYLDVGLRNRFYSMFLNYEALWMYIALESLFDAKLYSTDKYSLLRYLDSNVLESDKWEELISQRPSQFSGALQDRRQKERDLKNGSMKKFLLFVLFLDMAKIENFVPGNPCLFKAESKIKSSRQMLLEFSSMCLLNEADITRHLSLIGYHVHYYQLPLDEYYYLVTDIFIDMQDGIRLAKLIDRIFGEHKLMKLVKYPAHTKFTRISNIRKSLDILRDKGIVRNTDVNYAKAVASGSHDETLQLVWNLLFEWKISNLIDVEGLTDEIRSIKKDFVRRLGQEKIEFNSEQKNSDKLILILQWSQLICAFYNIKIVDFGESFSDGTAFCAIVSFYHPNLLDFSCVRQTICESDHSEIAELSRSDLKHNFELLADAVEHLGGMPAIIKPKIILEHGIDEKVTITLLSHMCSRLLVLRKEIKSAKTIQLAYRKHLAHKKFALRVKAAMIICRCIEKYALKRRLKYSNELRHNNATLIQKSWRNYSLRRTIKIRIQKKHFHAYFAGFRVRETISKQEEACIKIQAYFRMLIARKEYQLKLKYILLQASIRGFIARRVLSKKLYQITKIQAIWRSRNARLQLQQEKMFMQFQSYCRGYILRRKESETVRHICLIQSFSRAFLLRRKLRNQDKASQIIQSSWKMYQARKFLNLQKIIRNFQARIRGHEIRCHKKRLIESSTLLQSYARMFRHRSHFESIQNASKVIQRRYRALKLMQFESQNYRSLKRATEICQSRFRAKLAGRAKRENFLNIRNFVIMAQSRLRGYVARQNSAFLFAIIKIQSAFRMANTRKKFMLLKKGVRTIEERYIAKKLGIEQKKNLENVLSAVRFMQDRYRSSILSRKLRIRYNLLKKASTTVSAYRNGLKERKKYLAMKNSVGVIETRYVETLMSRQTRSEYLRKKLSAIIIQKWYLSQLETKICRYMFIKQKQAAVTIQKNVRRYFAQEELMKNKAAVKIQSMFKMILQKKKFSKVKNAVSSIESFYRAILIRRQDQNRYNLLRHHVTIVQARYREKRAVVMQRRQYLNYLKSIKIIQTAWRTHRLKIQTQSSIKIQAIWRKYQCRKKFLSYRNSVSVIESFYRTRILRRKFLKIRNFILSTQAYIRGKILRNRIQHEAAQRKKLIDKWVYATKTGLSSIKIQRQVRLYLAKKHRIRQENAAVVIQSSWRGYRSRSRYLKFKKSLINLQAAVRRRIDRKNAAALIITRFLREAAMKKNYIRHEKAATVIQAYWRGYTLRKFTTKALQEMRERVRRANEAVQEHMKLGNRAAMALEILSNSSSLSSTLKACHHLDVTTSLSKNCCLRLTEYDVIPVIMDLIQSCNRSKPHMEILAHAVNILYNLSKYQETSELVYQDSRCFEILVEVLQNYREMTNIFLTATKVIYLQLKYPERSEHFVSQKDVLRKFESIKSFVGKKMEMDLKVKKIAPQKSKYYQMSKTLKQINYE